MEASRCWTSFKCGGRGPPGPPPPSESSRELRRGKPEWGPDKLQTWPSKCTVASAMESSLPVHPPSRLVDWVYVSLQEQRRIDTGAVRVDVRPAGIKTRNSSAAQLTTNQMNNFFHLSSGMLCTSSEASHRDSCSISSPSWSLNNTEYSLSVLADSFSELSVSLDAYRPSTQLPPNYLCHLCFNKGHYIRDCPQGRPKRRGLTPYQGKVRCFGEYKCPKCKRKWKSANSWANMGQDCIKCHINVYPHKQRPLEKQDSPVDHTKEHPQKLCEKCKVLGFYCRHTQ
ncbi:zinc finger CCHC domain-containing protein 24-like isoform 2-T2 [Synchiropus picturatus]